MFAKDTHNISLKGKMEITGSPKDMVAFLTDTSIDPGYMRSSDQYKAMVDSLKALAEVDRAKAPEKYRLFKERAIQAAEDYVSTDLSYIDRFSDEAD